MQSIVDLQSIVDMQTQACLEREAESGDSQGMGQWGDTFGYIVLHFEPYD